MLRSPQTPVRPLSEAVSFPDIFGTPGDLDDNITTRKRKCSKLNVESAPSSEGQVNKDLLNLIRDLKTGQDAQFAKMNANFNTMRLQNEELLTSNNEIKKTMLNIVGEQKEMKLRIDLLEQKENNVDTLKKQIEILERKITESTIEIRNLPLENNSQIMKYVEKIHSLLNLKFDERDVRNSYRLQAKPDQIKPIVVEFNSIHMKTALLNALKKYNVGKQEKFNTTLLGLQGESKHIYINERLTKNAKQLHYQARELVRNNNWKFCWVARGRIFIRKEEGSPAIEIKDADQLKAVEPNQSKSNDK